MRGEPGCLALLQHGDVFVAADLGGVVHGWSPRCGCSGMWRPLPAPASGGGRRRPGAVVWLVLLDGGVSESGQQVDVLAEGEGVVAPLAVGAAVGVDVERDLDLAVVDL